MAAAHQLHDVGGAHGIAAVQHALPNVLQQRLHLRWRLAADSPRTPTSSLLNACMHVNKHAC